MARKQQLETLEQAVRRVMVESGLTRAEIARRTGIGYAAIHGFTAGTKGLHVESAQRILDALGYRVQLRKRR